MTLEFRQGGDAYDITIERGALSRAAALFDLNRKVLVVTGEGVPSQYAETILAHCPQAWLLTIPEGEANKTVATMELILASLLEHGFTRSDAIVAVGGGVVGDMAGFAAACYMRGIDWYNVPTTLLSQADSSVGGKTGVNFYGIKNLAGAFHQPSGVIVDPDTLDTLSPRLFSEGLAEVIKMAATSDAELFELLEKADDLRPIMPVVLAAALHIKIAVVQSDPTEKGLRAVLNFGHTIGHAIEAADAASYYPRCSAAAPRGTGGVPPEMLFQQADPTSLTSNPRCSAAAPRGTGGVPPETPCVAPPELHKAACGCENNEFAPEAACGTEAGAVSGDRLRPRSVSGRGPQDGDGEVGACSEPNWQHPVGGMSPEGAKSSGYNSSEVKQASFYHGEAVAVGMLYMAEEPARSRIENLLKKYGLPTEDPFTTEQLLSFASHDKKRKGGTIKTVRVSEPGSFRFEETTPDVLRTIIQARKS